MIVVEIPDVLAADPQVVPVDLCFDPVCVNITREHAHRHRIHVGRRVALAWRETCPTCDGSGMNHDPDLAYDGEPCSDCSNGERMVLGWTAEVAEVLPIVGTTHPCGNGQPHVYVRPGSVRRCDGRGVGAVHLCGSDDADWSPGRYALVLRDVHPWATANVGGAAWPTPESCRPFHGFAELDEVLR